MKKYINYFNIALLAMTLCACGKTTDNLQEGTQEEIIESSISAENLNEDSSNEESSEIQSTELKEIDGFEKADYQKYNSYASDNGLGGKLIYIDALIEKRLDIDNTSVLVVSNLDNEEEKWLVHALIKQIVNDEQLEKIIGKKVRIFGEYNGKSSLLQMPAINLLDEKYYIELENGEKINYIDINNAVEKLTKDLSYDKYDMEVVTVGEIEFEVPKDWTDSFKQIEEYIYYYYYDLMIMIQNTKTELNNESLILEKDEYISGVLGDEEEDKGKLISDEVIEVSGIKAIKLSFKKNISGEERNIQSVTFVYNNMLYSFGWCKTNELTDEYINGFNIFVNSIRKKVSNEEADKLIAKIITDVKTESEAKEPVSDNPKKEETVNSSSPTTGQSNALKKAQSYLRFTNFSHDGLVDQLEYEKFSHDEAVYGADNCGADWNEQAKEKAKSYLDLSGFSYKGIIEQLEYEKFTSEQAKYAADNCGADWYEQAKEKAASYISISSFSKNGLIEQLEYEGFTHDQAVYGAEQNGY